MDTMVFDAKDEGFWSGLAELGWSQAEFARRAGVSERSVTRWRREGVPTLAHYALRLKLLAKRSYEGDAC